MRENIGLFKAKVAEYNSTLNLNEDDWVEGYIAKKKSKCTSPHAPVWFDEWFMCVPVRNETYEYFEDVPIKFETLCECTGLKDKDGELIFENDILKTKEGWLQIVEYHHSMVGEVSIFSGFGCRCIQPLDSDITEYWHIDIDDEVTGNKFEEVESES